MSDLPVDLHPEYGLLADEVALLREELARLLAEEYDLFHLTRPHLLALYQQKIGAWEVQCLHVQIQAGRARRKLELAQAAINQGRQPDWQEIEGHLDLEFLAWQQQLQEATERLNAGNHRMKHLLPDAESRELKKLYVVLVKKLHPDVNPDLTRTSAAFGSRSRRRMKPMTRNNFGLWLRSVKKPPRRVPRGLWKSCAKPARSC